MTMNPTTPKLIPFDINIALKHPERVRRVGDQTVRCVQITHFALSNQTVIQWDNVDASLLHYRDYHNLALTAETKLVPWESIDEVPEGVYFRRIGFRTCAIVIGYTTVDNSVNCGGDWITLQNLFHGCEYSHSRNGPWLPCGKEVAV